MKEKFTIYNRKTNTIVTKFSGFIHGIFMESLVYALEYIMWEDDDTCNYEFYVNGSEMVITFNFDDEDEMYAKVNDDIVYRDNIRDYMKGR